MCPSPISSVPITPEPRAKMVHKIRAVVIIIKVALVLAAVCSPTVEGFRFGRSRKAKNAILDNRSSSTTVPSHQSTGEVACTCAIFLTGQFNKQNRSEPPRGNPGIQVELMQSFPCTTAGNKQCSSRCLDAIMKHLPNSPALICGTIDRDCFRERAYLFYQNCSPRWVNSNLSAGREFCCQDDRPVRCAKMAATIRKTLLAASGGGNGTVSSSEEVDDPEFEQQ